MHNKSNLHLNIIRVLKYLVFILGFCFMFGGSRVKADDTIELISTSSNNDEYYASVEYNPTGTYKVGNTIYFKSTSLTLTFKVNGSFFTSAHGRVSDTDNSANTYAYVSSPMFGGDSSKDYTISYSKTIYITVDVMSNTSGSVNATNTDSFNFVKDNRWPSVYPQDHIERIYKFGPKTTDTDYPILILEDEYSGLKQITYCYSYATDGCTSGALTKTLTGSEAEFQIKPNMEGKLYFLYNVTDNLGNSTGLSLLIYSSYMDIVNEVEFICDFTDPNISYDYPSSASSDYKQEHSFSFTISDDMLDISKQEYCWSTDSSTCNDTWTTFSGDKVSDTSKKRTGSYYLFVRATDDVGNTKTELVKYKSTSVQTSSQCLTDMNGVATSTCKNSTTTISTYKSYIFKFDNEEPTIEISRTASDAADIYKQTQTVSITVSDVGSSIKSKQYCISDSNSSDACDGTATTDDLNDANGTTENSQKTCVISWTALTEGSLDIGADMWENGSECASGKYYVHVKAVDQADNSQTETSVQLLIDNSEPKIYIRRAIINSTNNADSNSSPYVNKEGAVIYTVEIIDNQSLMSSSDTLESYVENEVSVTDAPAGCTLSRQSISGDSNTVTISYKLTCSEIEANITDFKLNIKASNEAEIDGSREGSSITFDVEGAKITVEEGKGKATPITNLPPNLKDVFNQINLKVVNKEVEIVEEELDGDTLVLEVAKDENIKSAEYALTTTEETQDSDFVKLIDAKGELKEEENIKLETATVYYITIKVNYVDDTELKKLFILSKNNKWVISNKE